jgi:methylated-DNA-[protein]-cysteine S-methyltransferase
MAIPADGRIAGHKTARGYALFDTPIGRGGIAWGGRGVAGVQLPESRD